MVKMLKNEYFRSLNQICGFSVVKKRYDFHFFNI